MFFVFKKFKNKVVENFYSDRTSQKYLYLEEKMLSQKVFLRQTKLASFITKICRREVRRETSGKYLISH